MTENEALGYLKNSKRQKSMLEILPGSDIGNTIIKALEELKQYRTIGTPENCDYSNLRALCQLCHNRYDAKHRAETRRKVVE